MSSGISLFLLRFLFPAGLSVVSFFLRPFFGFGSAMKTPLLNSGSESSSSHDFINRGSGNVYHRDADREALVYDCYCLRNEREFDQVLQGAEGLKWTDVGRTLTSSLVRLETLSYFNSLVVIRWRLNTCT